MRTRLGGRGVRTLALDLGSANLGTALPAAQLAHLLKKKKKVGGLIKITPRGTCDSNIQ